MQEVPYPQLSLRCRLCWPQTAGRCRRFRRRVVRFQCLSAAASGPSTCRHCMRALPQPYSCSPASAGQGKVCAAQGRHVATAARKGAYARVLTHAGALARRLGEGAAISISGSAPGAPLYPPRDAQWVGQQGAGRTAAACKVNHTRPHARRITLGKRCPLGGARPRCVKCT
jgi:hypothetical protein